MGLFGKSKHTQLTEIHNSAHKAWHTYSLQDGRHPGWVKRDQDLLAEARAALAAADAAPADEETGALPDTTALKAEVVRLEGVVARRLRDRDASAAKLAMLAAAKNEADVAVREEEFNGQLEAFAKQLHLVVELNSKLAEAQASLPSRPQFAVPALNAELLTWFDREMDARINPPSARPVNYDGVVEFARPWSPGGLSGVRYNPGEGGAFDVKLASEIVASGFGRFKKETPANQAALAQARQRLAAIDRTATILHEGANVDAA